MYLPYYLQSVLNDSTMAKVGAAALTSMLITASGAYGSLFFVVVACWLTDMVFGMARVLREALKPMSERKESFRWSRAGDGILRLIVICIIPGLMAMVGGVSSDVMASITPVEPGFSDLVSTGLATFCLSWLLFHELIGVLDNAASLHPAMNMMRDRFNTFTRTRREK